MKGRDSRDRYPDAMQAEVVAANRERREVQLSEEQMAELGHRKRSLTRVIRAFCMDCMGGSSVQVKLCTSVGCNLYPYRFGKNPYRGQLTPEDAARFAKLVQVQSSKSLGGEETEKMGPGMGRESEAGKGEKNDSL